MAVFLVITVAMVSLSAWGFYRLAHTRSITSGEVQIALPQALILFMFMFSFVVALSASAIASPAVSAEVESGVLQTVVTRPIRRSEVMIGKWLGLAFLVAGYSVVVAALEMAVVDWVSGFLPPNPVAGRALPVRRRRRAAHLGAGVQHAAVDARHRRARCGVVRVCVAVRRCRSARHDLQDPGAANRRSGWPLPACRPTGSGTVPSTTSSRPRSSRSGLRRPGPEGNPFFALAPPSWLYLMFALIWLLAVLGVGLVSFERREL